MNLAKVRASVRRQGLSVGLNGAETTRMLETGGKFRKKTLRTELR